MGLLVPFLLFSQSGTGSDSHGELPEIGTPSGAAETGQGRVDESTLLLGEPRSPQPGQTASVSPFSFWDLVRMVLVLGCVVGIIYLVFYLLKRAGSGKFARTDLIRIVGSQTLPGNRAIYLVQVGSQVFMVGAGSESITLLGEITEQETVDSVVLSASQLDDGSRKNFGDILSSLVKGGQGESLDLMRHQRERLQRLRS